jgi:hypothetical protein
MHRRHAPGPIGPEAANVLEQASPFVVEPGAILGHASLRCRPPALCHDEIVAYVPRGGTWPTGTVHQGRGSRPHPHPE